MIEWTIDKEGDGPMKAYKYLDVASENPYKTNEILSKMTSAIVRNQIANSSIDEVLKNRQLLRDAVIEEMNEVTKGWGIHLSTVEVLDVNVSSSSLLHDMQTEFRETSAKQATADKLVNETAIKEEQMSHQLVAAKRE